MTPIYKYSVMILTFMSLYLFASRECVESSWHLAQKPDYKNLHPVEPTCTCPCQRVYKISRIRNKCLQCGHEAIERPLTTSTYPTVFPSVNIQALKRNQVP